LNETCCELFVIWIKINHFSFPLDAQPDASDCGIELKGTKADLQRQVPQAFHATA
jgi:hypothetical protein